MPRLAFIVDNCPYFKFQFFSECHFPLTPFCALQHVYICTHKRSNLNACFSLSVRLVPFEPDDHNCVRSRRNASQVKCLRLSVVRLQASTI